MRSCLEASEPRRWPRSPHERLSTIISATDLSTGNAVRFGSKISSCSPHGFISEPVLAADAIAAAAAFPALLPQLQRTYTFNRLDGSQHRKAMQMIDGGVYDNLGLSPLLPGRSKKYTNHAYDLEYVIAIDAGIGRTAVRAPNCWPGRMKRSFEIAHTRAQDGSRAQVHELAQSRSAPRVRVLLFGHERLPPARGTPRPRRTANGGRLSDKLCSGDRRGPGSAHPSRRAADTSPRHYCPPLGT